MRGRLGPRTFMPRAARAEHACCFIVVHVRVWVWAEYAESTPAQLGAGGAWSRWGKQPFLIARVSRRFEFGPARFRIPFPWLAWLAERTGAAAQRPARQRPAPSTRDAEAVTQSLLSSSGGSRPTSACSATHMRQSDQRYRTRQCWSGAGGGAAYCVAVATASVHGTSARRDERAHNNSAEIYNK